MENEQRRWRAGYLKQVLRSISIKAVNFEKNETKGSKLLFRFFLSLRLELTQIKIIPELANNMTLTPLTKYRLLRLFCTLPSRRAVYKLNSFIILKTKLSERFFQIKHSCRSSKANEINCNVSKIRSRMQKKLFLMLFSSMELQQIKVYQYQLTKH